ncbi:hypothetical protein SAMN05192533_10838 [Mesobacillus persicus]|uniref:Uncharacterized protein n=1 Tax=Mesobacillus persicus TaxID=930146 RepID=A0A1H8D1C7_9BACI|nr:hypothetical protein [Mesobacillus persicus]SEN01113.1 hypothetical protein SAMN05192533_10838 [Mesobacillus persicus]
MSEQTRENELNAFFEKGDWVRPDGIVTGKDDTHHDFLWDDHHAVRKHLEENPNHFVYTLRDESGGWINKGWRISNRIGHFISRVDVPMDEMDAVMYYPEDEELDEEVIDEGAELLELLGYEDVDFDCYEEMDGHTEVFFVVTDSQGQQWGVQLHRINEEYNQNLYWIRKYPTEYEWREVKK